MTLAGRLTLYRIERDHFDATGFYRIDVPEVEQSGVLYGVSAHTRAKS